MLTMYLIGGDANPPKNPRSPEKGTAIATTIVTTAK